jgi:hypothetical protein
MHIIGHRKPFAPLPAVPIRWKQAARADRFPPYMRARMGKAVGGTGEWEVGGPAPGAGRFTVRLAVRWLASRPGLSS